MRLHPSILRFFSNLFPQWYEMEDLRLKVARAEGYRSRNLNLSIENKVLLSGIDDRDKEIRDLRARLKVISEATSQFTGVVANAVCD